MSTEEVYQIDETPETPVETHKRSAPKDEEGEEVVNVLELSETRLESQDGDVGEGQAETDENTQRNINSDVEGPENDEKKSLVKKDKKKKKKRPARPQIDADKLKEKQAAPQTGTVYNIWYNKWSGGDREDKYASQTHAEGRCNIARDSGYTKADKVPGSFFCLYFARGICPNGKTCNYLHRLPEVTDIFNPNVDCFGRDKRADYRDDMGGIGSFMRQNRTIYVGRINVTDDIEEVVARHFAEWGDIERVRVLNSRGVAFITYMNEANAQFAKEAMAHQSLDHNEILNVRWATVDPNPLAKAREQRRLEEQAAEAVKKLLPPDYLKELESRALQPAKRRKM
ncbi:hypothetical protein V1511DRAFT_497197 [Dipodascopsis uninucleata]